ncbi:sulfite exporter TauE/SafE family protein [Flavihumibacter rivuli]|uniref:sulfite exporter TauE/SafE family protein n=1 Tax=Flavihumibacter rivuli TaxID=2838156 RepID=UPI001BDE5123|nr:sulfite exporter TauE/SafE family protein [Flavihumibacter rivuli]ULQ54874.1 sulfite exporter TauE/SafE family protein [Flavihumibacter rivuli]
MDVSLIFYPLLFVVAFLYASVGHGGASGYLALMALYGFAPEVMKPTALLLNLFVSLTSYIQFYRGGHFKWKIFLPLALASIPMAFIGGLLTIDATIYKKILGLLLLLPILRFFLFKDSKQAGTVEPQLWMSILIGASIGFLSGLIGIGGGIILSPILLLLNWTDQKQTAAISALFIFVNSLSGLFGQLTKGINFSTDMVLMVGIAFSGGLLGAWFGSLKFRQEVLKFTLATVLTMAAFKLLFTSA